ncbi:hypothetical protein AGMMS50293_21030 [Spirochaetia bacterium]|nr:hypothetical protein AGMMS50293_21030 [Spirochaetia bacterium]
MKRAARKGGFFVQLFSPIAMTANVFREDIKHCLAVGMNDHVGKPLNLDEVLLKLNTWLV